MDPLLDRVLHFGNGTAIGGKTMFHYQLSTWRQTLRSCSRESHKYSRRTSVFVTSGNRSFSILSLNHIYIWQFCLFVKCASCGPEGTGTCFGANMCCGSDFGCFFKTKETNICLFTSLKSSQSCDERFWQVYFKSAPCSINDDKLDGICVADQLCCSLGNPNSFSASYFSKLSIRIFTRAM